ncbi:hypothetical protein QOZ80_2AG0100430 [Eleusine coracana subsp. coracana]|nr:hypothetical protein QOZ80_2AG0100430 [Eleusine coracana subsp. coracana]
MDGEPEDEWEDENFLAELFRVQDEAAASRNPNPTPSPAPSSAPTPAPAPAPSSALTPAYDTFAAPISCMPPAYATVSYLPAASAPSSPPPALRFSPPREFTQHPPPRLPPATSVDGDALARGFSPPRELSQRPTTEESDCAIFRMPVGDRLMGTGGNLGAKREKESGEVERLKKELNRLNKQMNDLKNECDQLRKDRTKKDHQIKAKEVEIQNLKKANGGFAGKDVCGIGTNTDKSVHVAANGALHAANTWAITRTDKSNGKVKGTSSLQQDLGSKQRHQTDLPQALELKDLTMIDNTTSTSGGLYLEENPHLEPRSVLHKEVKTIGVQTDNTWNSDHLDLKKVPLERISSNLRAIWGNPTNGLLGRNLISKIIVSCSEDILALLQCTRLPDKLGTSSETSSSMNDAISQLYDIFVKMSNEKIAIQTFLESLLNLCSFENAAIVGRTLRILQRILQLLLNYGTKSNRSVPSGTMFLLNHISVFSVMLQTGIKYSDESIRVDALFIMILIVRTTDPKEERQKFEFTSTMEKLHQLLQKDNGFLVKKHSVRLLFLLLNCPAMLKLLCSGGKDGSEQISEGSESDRSKQAISLVLEDLSECLTCEGKCSQGIELCRLAVILLAYIASSGKLGYEVLLGSVTTRGASFLELIMEVLASQMQYETQELLKERCLLMREVLILLNRLASHANFSKPTLEVLTGSKLCATMTIDVANRLPQTQTGNDLGELAQKFRSRVHAFLEEKPLAADGSYSNASFKSYKFQEQTDSSVIRPNPSLAGRVDVAFWSGCGGVYRAASSPFWGNVVPRYSNGSVYQNSFGDYHIRYALTTISIH